MSRLVVLAFLLMPLHSLAHETPFILTGNWSASVPGNWKIDQNAKNLGEKFDYASVVAGFFVSPTSYVQVRFRKCNEQCEEQILNATMIQESTESAGSMCYRETYRCGPDIVRPRNVNSACGDEIYTPVNAWGENGRREMIRTPNCDRVVDITQRQVKFHIDKTELLTVALLTTTKEYPALKSALDSFITSLRYQAADRTTAESWNGTTPSGWKSDDRSKDDVTDPFDFLPVLAGFMSPSGGYLQVRQGNYNWSGLKNRTAELKWLLKDGASQCCYSDRCQRISKPVVDGANEIVCSPEEKIGNQTEQSARIKFKRKVGNETFVMDMSEFKRPTKNGKTALTLVVLTTKEANYAADRLGLDQFLRQFANKTSKR